MGKVQFTPGPWEWWTSCSWKRLTSKDANGQWMKQGNVLCPDIALDGHPVLSVSEEDMHLIAAAPDLYEALQRLRKWMPPAGRDEQIDADLAFASAAIAKASPSSSKGNGG